MSDFIERHPYLTGGAVLLGGAGLAAGGTWAAKSLMKAQAAAKAAKAATKPAAPVAAKAVATKAPRVSDAEAAANAKRWREQYNADKAERLAKKQQQRAEKAAKKAAKNNPTKSSQLDPYFFGFADELVKIALSSEVVRDPNDHLDRRTIRKHRKPNPRLLPAPLPSGKLVS